MEDYISLTEDGAVSVSNIVLAGIAAAAAVEVEGVVGLSSNSPADLLEIFGKKPVTKGVSVTISEQQAVVDLLITVKCGSSLAILGTQVQKAVSSAIESMTGLKPEVRVHISGIAL